LSATSDRTVTLIVAGDPHQLTGGYIYDRRIADALRALGWSVHVVGLAGRFPEADDRASTELAQTLAACPDGARVVIDGLALGGLPEVARAHAGRLELTALVHHPLADETGLDAASRTRLLDSERRALFAVDRVIVTSAFTARRLRGLEMPCERIHVVEPGVDGPARPGASAPREEGGPTQRLLCVASLTPRKGHLILLEALAGMTERDWHCRCIGSAARDPDYAATIFAAARAQRLDGRVSWPGEVDETALAAAYDDADVLVVPSLYEGYGMVVTEALAHGIPVIATDGGALADTLPAEAGLQVPAGDAPALRDALARWCDDPALRQRLRAGSQRASRRLGDWIEAGAAFAHALASRTTDSTIKMHS
jgi:glycosyltransferase involved in cell wall biosynthesis